MKLLRAEKLSKRFGDLTALDGLDLEVEAGEVVCLLGANGAGKTTTINLFLGFVEPDAGEAWIEDFEVSAHPQTTKRHVGYIPENVALYPTLSGLENLALFNGLAGNRCEEAELLQYLTRAGLSETAARRRTHTYSKGMRQKVGIAAVLAKGARVLLLDEPLSGLDPAAANGFCQTIRTLRDEGHAVLMATHDLFRAKEIGDRIGIMKAGRLVNMLDAAELDGAELERIYLRHMHDAGSEAA